MEYYFFAVMGLFSKVYIPISISRIDLVVLFHLKYYERRVSTFINN